MSKRTRDLLKARTELLRQFRIAFRKNAPASVVDGLRAEINDVQNRLNRK